MAKRSYIKLATEQKMRLSRKTIVIGCSVVAIAAASISLWQLGNSEKSMASTLTTTTISKQLNATVSENAANARTETVAKQFTAAKATAASASFSRTESKSMGMTMATEEQALDVMAKKLSEDFNGRNFAVMMENATGKIDLSATYTYPGRPDMSQQELEDLRKSNAAPAAAPTAAAPAHLTASTEAPAPDLTASDNKGLRKFEIVSADKVAMESVNLVKFDIQRKFNTVLLSWNTNVERYSDYFAVEKSTDGKNFQEIGRVNGAGDYNNKLLYAFVDRKPADATAWYRIRQFDFSGNEKTFPAKKVK